MIHMLEAREDPKSRALPIEFDGYTNKQKIMGIGKHEITLFGC